jgi:hypothetical protein
VQVERFAGHPALVGIMGWAFTLRVVQRMGTVRIGRRPTPRGREVFAVLPDSVRTPAPQVLFLRQGCDAWQVPTAPDSVRGVTDSAIPTRVLSGSCDGQTGAQWGSYVSAHVSHATVVTVPGVGHGVYTDVCGARVIASFFSNPAQPDTSCGGSTPPPAYRTAPLP